MFSPTIQNLINNSGRTEAMSRASQLIRYVDNFNKQVNPTEAENVQTTSPKFSQVLQESIGDDYRFRDTGATKAVFGTLVRPKNKLSALTDSISNVTGVSASSATSATTGAKKTYSKQEISDIISKISAKHGVNEKLVRALIRQESGFNPKVVSKAGATGLMQLMPSTAKGLGVTNAYDAEQNIYGGTKYLKGLLDRFDNNKELALAAYNAGPNAVKKYKGIPPYAETQNYVKSIMKSYDKFKGGV